MVHGMSDKDLLLEVSDAGLAGTLRLPVLRNPPACCRPQL